jgi:SynChlorMet cassette protein ScmD
VSSGRPIANPFVVLREEFDDWAVLFNPDNGNAVGINPVGVAVWKMLDGEHNLSDIVNNVRQEFDDVSPSVDEELGAFIDDLIAKGFAGHEVKAQG